MNGSNLVSPGSVETKVAEPENESVVESKTGGTEVSTASLRLPLTLADCGKAFAQAHGISLNGLIALALGEYLRDRGYFNPQS